MVELSQDEPTHRLVRYTAAEDAEHARSVAFGLAPQDIERFELPLVPNRCSPRRPAELCSYCCEAGYFGWRLKSMNPKDPTNG